MSCPPREAEVFGRVRSGFRVLERTSNDFSGTLTEFGPGPAGVDRFTVDRQPRPDLAQDSLLLLGYCPVGARADVEQQIAVLGDHVRQHVNYEFRRLVGVVLDVAPG